MNGRWRIWVLIGLGVAVVIAAIYFPMLKRRVRTAAKIPQPSEEQARRELTTPTPKNTSDPVVKAKMFWASDEDESALSPITIELALASDPVLRAKQVLNTLLAGPVSSDLRTLPPDAALLAFYLLPDGTGIADFSEALATSTPSGIESEQLAVNSIARTLEANVSQVKRIKILIHGQEVETLAGHLDLTQMFIVNTKAAQPFSLSVNVPVKPSAADGATPASQPPAAKGKEPRR
ncbi:MAG TPA: GerMN domain-containing protein [Candidatus Acidoferrum sp.]|nr:GerMN domain-containing protein [Candidatus Acidoferrum sp.]